MSMEVLNHVWPIIKTNSNKSKTDLLHNSFRLPVKIGETVALPERVEIAVNMRMRRLCNSFKFLRILKTSSFFLSLVLVLLVVSSCHCFRFNFVFFFCKSFSFFLLLLYRESLSLRMRPNQLNSFNQLSERTGLCVCLHEQKSINCLVFDDKIRQTLSSASFYLFVYFCLVFRVFFSLTVSI